MSSQRLPVARRFALPFALALAVGLAAACGKSDSAADAGAPAGTSITVAPGASGGVSVAGGPQLHGDPAACEAFRKCCPAGQTSGPTALACGLAPAGANGDCTRALATIVGVIKEQGLPAPAGCAADSGGGKGDGTGQGGGRKKRKVEGQHAD